MKLKGEGTAGRVIHTILGRAHTSDKGKKKGSFYGFLFERDLACLIPEMGFRGFLHGDKWNGMEWKSG